MLPSTSCFLFPWITAFTEEAAGYEVASNTPGPSWALFFSSKLCYKSCLNKKLSNMILLLQFVTQYFETWWKPVDIFKKIVRVQHIPILMLPLQTQCCVWGTSYLNDKNCPPKYSHILPQHWNGEGGRLASGSCWIIISKKHFWKGGFWGRNATKRNMTIFLIDCMMQCFLISFYQILWQKVLKMKVKITDISGVKINLFFLHF